MVEEILCKSFLENHENNIKNRIASISNSVFLCEKTFYNHKVYKFHMQCFFDFFNDLGMTKSKADYWQLCRILLCLC